MTLLATLLERITTSYTITSKKALEIAERILTPAGPIPRTTIQRLLRRARRNGAWLQLPIELKALLTAAATAKTKTYRNPLLLSLIRRAWLLIEQATMRGKAVVTALVYILAIAPAKLSAILASGLDTIITLGIQLLNNPLLTAAAN